MTYTWKPEQSVSGGWWKLGTPDGRLLEVRHLTSNKWVWRCGEADCCSEICGWAKNFDLAKVRALLAWKDTASAADWDALTVDVFHSLTPRPTP